ncbi:MAG: hypothetical protein RCG15_06500 [Candidatus Rickettsia vulgarisii]
MSILLALFTEKLDEVREKIESARSGLQQDKETCNIQLLKILDYLEVVKDAMRIITMFEQLKETSIENDLEPPEKDN